MARQKVTIDNLADVVGDILQDYVDDVNEVSKEAIHKTALAGVKALKSESPKKTGKYSKGWRTFSNTTRTQQTEKIYNAAKPTLTHLLEKGHAKRGGGRVPGKPHVQPVMDELEKTLPKEVAKSISSITK